MSKTDFAVSKDGTRIAYSITGDGPTLIVVAGALGYTDLPFLRSFVADLAKHFRLAIYDRRGRGGSGDTQPYTVDKEIDDLDAVVRAVGDPAIVLGTSSGAALALEAAARGVPMSGVVALMRLMPMWKKLVGAAHTLPYDAAIMNNFELPSSRYRGIRVPTLVVGGGKSPAALKAAVRAVGEIIPGARVVEVPRQTHAISGAALAPVVREFAATGPVSMAL